MKVYFLIARHNFYVTLKENNNWINRVSYYVFKYKDTYAQENIHMAVYTDGH